MLCMHVRLYAFVCACACACAMCVCVCVCVRVRVCVCIVYARACVCVEARRGLHTRIHPEDSLCECVYVCESVLT